jgi:hypothetical protein
MNAVPNAAPTVTVSNATATHGQTLAASALFSGSDTDGDAIVSYQLWDGTSDASSGAWKVNGVVQAANQAIDVTAANLANASFVSGSGSDQLYVRANDGLVWGDWKAFTVTAPPDAAPVVSASDRTFTASQTVAASTLFSVTDAESDTITKYEFWDSNGAAGSGQWKVNGVAQQANQAIGVLAADLANASFTAASVAATNDLLYVRAFDGLLWSDWKAFNAHV